MDKVMRFWQNIGKNKRAVIRIIAAAVAFALAFVLEKATSIPSYAVGIMYASVYLLIGWDVLARAAKNIVKGKVLDENFLMSIATIGAFAIAQYPEAVAVMLLYQIGELFQSYAVGKSRKSIAALMDIRPDKAIVLRQQQEQELSPEDVIVGETIVVRAGEKIPLDGVVIAGNSYLNTSALTGESVPRWATEGDAVISGSINLDGVLHIRAEKLFYDSTVSKILDLVENAGEKKAKAENFITKFAKYYTPIVVISALLLAIVPPLFGGSWNVWVFRALTFLVVSCPCALVISVPLGFFGGIGGASKNGILLKGASSLEQLNKVKTFVMDKTGTLTKGIFEVQSVMPIESKDEILRLAACAEHGSNHPIAKSILKAAPTNYPKDYAITEIAGMGVKAIKDGSTILCGNAKLMQTNSIDFQTADGSLGSVVYVAHNGSYMGSIIIADAIRKETVRLIAQLKRQGIQTYMLTGDNEQTAATVAKQVGIDHYKAELLPADKVAELEKIMQAATAPVAFVGDGINDAPALMRADVGISMGGIGSDSAIEASDIVLMHDNTNGILFAKKTAAKTLRIVRANIIFALAVKFAVLVLSALGFADMWLAVFADVGVSMLAIINSLRTIV